MLKLAVSDGSATLIWANQVPHVHCSYRLLSKRKPNSPLIMDRAASSVMHCTA